MLTLAGDTSQNLESYLTVNDNLHTALKKYDQLAAKLAATNQHDDESKERRSATHRGSLAGGSNQNENNDDDDDDDPFAEFVRARAGSTQTASKSHASGEAQLATPQSRSNQIDAEDDDDPFASFVQQRVAKIFGSDDPVAVEEETKPAAPEKNLIDLWGNDTCSRFDCSSVVGDRS